MEGEPPTQVSTAAGAVFLSYASQDAEAAQRICDALRAAGIEVWFDKSELRGGDAWDRRIREQIHECRLFMPIVSAHTEARIEGYFRREWKLAVDRTHDLSERVAFLVPVVIDSTSEQKADVPDAFRHVQWTRLAGGETSPAFVARIQKLLVPGAPTRAAAPTPSGSTAARPSKSRLHPTWTSNAVLWGISALLVMGLAYLIAVRLWPPQHSQASAGSQKTTSSTSATPSTAAAFNPPPHSIAVLPFVNLSGDKEQEYFSDGLTEELLNSLSRISALQVAARTSSFSFQGEHPDIATVAHKLNVGAVLEGSVRRSSHTIRVTAQLVNGVTGFHLWSETYDRGLGDSLKLQTEIATAVASALKVTLLGNEAAKIDVGGTHNPAAFDLYLRALKAALAPMPPGNRIKLEAAVIADYTGAINLDPNYALAYAARSLAFLERGTDSDTPREVMRVSYDKAQADARKAIALAPDLADGHLALALLYEKTLEFTRASEEFERALALGSGTARVLKNAGLFAVAMGRTDTGLNALRRALQLDPLNPSSHSFLAGGLVNLRRYNEGMAAYKDAFALVPDWRLYTAFVGTVSYLLGDLQAARSNCEPNSEKDGDAQFCLALTYEKLGRHADAEAMLAKLRARVGDSGAMGYSEIYAQWGDKSKALEWLESAMRLRDPGLEWLRLDPLVDPVRNEPRFQAIERALKFPN